MPLLNYTTKISASKTVGEINGLLAKAGAAQILTEYEEGQPSGVAFALTTPTGMHRYRLPVKVLAVEIVLRKQKVAAAYLGRAHAERVAWRIMKDWLEAQLAIIQTEMVSLDQVMLPYMTTETGQTVYEMFLDQQLAIGPSS